MLNVQFFFQTANGNKLLPETTIRANLRGKTLHLLRLQETEAIKL